MYAIPIQGAQDGDKSLALTANYHRNGARNLCTKSAGTGVCEKTNDQAGDVYLVEGGYITTKTGRKYPIKLEDGYYRIRKLSVSECKRLQTVPEWFDFSVISNTQAYKCLGNGWTVEVIAHLIKCALNQQTDKSRLDYWI